MSNLQRFDNLPINTKFKTEVGIFIKISNDFPTFDEFMYGTPKMNSNMIQSMYGNPESHPVSFNRRDLVEVVS